MVAIAQQARPRHLRLVTEDEFVVERVPAPRPDEFVFLRRRLAAVGVVVLLLIGTGLALGRASGERGSLSIRSVPAGDGAATLPIAQHEYVVQPGDTLWKIARALQPEGDVRPLVYELGKARKGAPLRVGERVTLP